MTKKSPHRYTLTHKPTGKVVSLVCATEAEARRELVGVKAAALVLLGGKPDDYSEAITVEG